MVRGMMGMIWMMLFDVSALICMVWIDDWRWIDDGVGVGMLVGVDVQNEVGKN